MAKESRPNKDNSRSGSSKSRRYTNTPKRQSPGSPQGYKPAKSTHNPEPPKSGSGVPNE